MTREIVTHTVDGVRLVGTHHRPSSGTPARIGVLLLNSGPAPRAGNSDLSVAVCDRLAHEGVHAFRFDMPGLGDSQGDSPTDIPSFWDSVQRGRNDHVTASLLGHLSRECGIDGLAVGGLCAGAVTAIRLAGARTPHLLGLVLLEPNFRTSLDMILPRRGAGTTPPAPTPSPTTRSFSRRVCWRLHDLCLRIGLVGYPPETNPELFRSLRSSLERGVPVIAVMAEGLASEEYMDVVERRLSTNARQRLMRVRIQQSNHILTAGESKARAAEALAAWARDGFARSRLAG